MEYPFIAITPRSTLTKSSSNCQDLSVCQKNLKIICIRKEYLMSYN